MPKKINLIESLIVLVIIGIIGWIVVHVPSSEERARMEYEQGHPCIYGIRYIKTGRDGRESLTPMIDPATMQPLKCDSEALP